MPTPALLVTQTTPVNKVKATTNQQTQQEASEPFKQMLLKQVKKENEKVSGSSITEGEIETPVDVASADVSAATISEAQQVKQENEKALNAATLESKVEVPTDGVQAVVTAELIKETQAVEGSVDAQLLSRAATTKSLKDVTDGGVALERKPDGATLSDRKEAARVVNVDVSTLTEPKRTLSGQNTVSNQAKDLGRLADNKVDAPLDKSILSVGDRLQEKPLKENVEFSSNKLSQVLATESRPQSFAETFAERNVKAVSDIAAISMQTSTAKPITLPEPMQLQAAGASNVINAFPGKTGWNEAISQKVVWMVGAAEQSATLTLNPKDLGPLQVIIHVNNEKADATFISENPEVRKALEEGMSGLRNSMGQTGVELGQANVNTNKEHQDSQQANKEQASRGASNNDATQDSADMKNLGVRTHVSNGLVDTFA